jgi:hypothetical protein
MQPSPSSAQHLNSSGSQLRAEIHRPRAISWSGCQVPNAACCAGSEPSRATCAPLSINRGREETSGKRLGLRTLKGQSGLLQSQHDSSASGSSSWFYRALNATWRVEPAAPGWTRPGHTGCSRGWCLRENFVSGTDPVSSDLFEPVSKLAACS